MNKKIYLIVFLAMISLPFVGMLWYRTDMTIEKRYARAFPSVIKEEKWNMQFFSELTDYFSDYFAYRQELATVDAVIKSRVFQVSNNDKVIVGKDKWLFFEETKDDYLGRNVLSGRGVHNCAKVLALLQEGAGRQGCKFLFVPAPNKNSLYPEYMPDRYVKESTENSYSLLKKEMEKQQVDFVDLKEAFGKQNTVMYHKLDTHWNNEGAAFAGGQILEHIGKEYVDYSNEAYQVLNCFSGDLWGMLYPKWNRLDENVIYDRQHIYEYCNDADTTEDMFIETSCQGKDGALVMFRDSFGNALLPFLADEYGAAFFTKAVPYDWSLIRQYEADTVILELTERHIASLQQEIPIMQGPERDIEGKVTKILQSDTSVNIAEQGEYYVVYGVLDSRYVEKNADILISVERNGKKRIFEAFPAAYGLNGGAGYEDYQYGIYLDKNVIGTKDCGLEVIAGRDGEYYSLQKISIYNGEKGE